MTRALPDAPACWGWPLPPLPQPNNAHLVRMWQAGRCAVCGGQESKPYGLVEDHDHDSGDVRGYLCEECNFNEGRRTPHPVFLLYRDRYPTRMIGVLERYKVAAKWEEGRRCICGMRFAGERTECTYYCREPGSDDE